MAIQYGQFIWGFEVFDSGTSANNKLDFDDAGSTFAATLTAGVYTADELAAEVQRAMRAANTVNQDNTCTFSYSTLKFTLTGTSLFSLKFATGASATPVDADCSGLLGFEAADKTLSTSYTSDAIVGAPSSASTAHAWTMAEPTAYTTPIIPQTLATSMAPATQTQRSIVARQYVTDGMTVDSVYFGTLRKVQIAFKALTPTEQVKMEAFLEWVTRFKRFTWQPDKTLTAGMKLVLSNPKEIRNAYEWLTRPEVGYGTLTFYEQLS